jgi:microcystin-dependent protein
MSDPFLGEIKMMGFNFPPRGWALCNGQLLPINQNQALFSLLGTTFGGNGQTTFALPNLQGRVPIHTASSHLLGEAGGATTHALTQAELPQHTHSIVADTAEGGATPGATSRLAASSGGNLYGPPNNTQPMEASSITATGGNPHENVQPYLAISLCIALQGVFPSRN